MTNNNPPLSFPGRWHLPSPDPVPVRALLGRRRRLALHLHEGLLHHRLRQIQVDGVLPRSQVQVSFTHKI